MSNDLAAKEKEVEIARLKHAILESELKKLKKQKEIDEIDKSIETYKRIIAEKGA
jgi:hypothetical protein